MKPPTTTGEVLILEGRLECAILYDALRPTPEDAVVKVPEPADDLRARLDSQTHHLEKYNPGLHWNTYPTFHVLERDVDFALAAAQLTAAEPFSKPWASHFKRYEQRQYERRQQAAQSIRSALVTYLYPQQGQLQA